LESSQFDRTAIEVQESELHLSEDQSSNRSESGIENDVEKSSLPTLPWRARLQYLYLLRVPILMAFTIVALPIVSLTVARELLGNLYVVNLWNIFCTLFATEVLMLGIMVVTRVVLLNGRERFGVPQGLSKDVVRKKLLSVPQVLLAPMFYGLIFSNGQSTDLKTALTRCGVGVLAIVAALIAAFAMLWLSVLFSPRYPNPDAPGDRSPAHLRFYLPFAFMRKWIDNAFAKNWLTPEDRSRFGAMIRTWPESIRAGYFDPNTCLPYPGQLLTMTMLVLSYVLYQCLGYFKHLRLGVPSPVPAIAYVVILLIVLNWLLSVVAFFLDYFLLPLLIPVLAFILSSNFLSLPDAVFNLIQPIVVSAVAIALVLGCASFLSQTLRRQRPVLVTVASLCVFIANLISSSDHFYEIRPSKNPPKISPAQVLNAAFRLHPDKYHPKGRITVIATAGGGIQAAAWTARVLTGLQEQVKAESPDLSFANSIAAISSVSGGAVGTMFFVDRYQTSGGQQGFPAATNLSEIVDDAKSPALDDVAWAMVYPDLTRVLLPFLKHTSTRLIDRGWALEQAWRRRGNLDYTLSEWRAGVTEGFRPAVVFNSTLVESGEPFLLATTDISEPDSSGLASKTLPVVLPGYDVPVVTAVRLAASFPFVTPASRALYDPRPGDEPALSAGAKCHVVDGGYYDNYGVSGLLQFLSQALIATPRDKIPDILILQIRSFPSEKSPTGEDEGWFFQGWAPLSALLNVRTAAQLLRDRDSLGDFVALWSARGAKIRLATFEFQGDKAPLSWKMNQQQMDAIQSEWSNRIAGANNQDWLQVNCFFHPDARGCESLSELVRKGAW
jgi:hypothetical protein